MQKRQAIVTIPGGRHFVASSRQWSPGGGRNRLPSLPMTINRVICVIIHLSHQGFF